MVQALNNVSFRVRHGRVTGLIGPDSAGKTTLMRLAAGLLAPDSGSITVLGKNAATQSLEVQGSIGYMPQRFGLYEDLTVQENLDLYADLQGVPQANRADRYRELLQMAGLAPFTRRLAGQLSGGMKQKLGLACTLVRQPALLLLDEPTVGVDPLSRRELWAIVNRLVRNENTTVLLSTAYLDEAERCDEVILLHDGQLLDQGDPKILRDRMQGRTYSVTAANISKRSLQAHLSQAPGVLDALIQGEHVRLVMEDATRPDLEAMLPGIQDAAVTEVPPRYEDSFIALLKGQAHPDRAAPSPVRSAQGTVVRKDGKWRGRHRSGSTGAAFRQFPRRQRRQLCRIARRGLRLAGRQRRRQDHHVSHVVRPAATERRQPAGRRRRSPACACCGTRTHRLHVAEIFSLWPPQRHGEPALLQQRLWLVAQAG